MSPSDDAEAALDRIHGLPLREFTAARNAAAKELAAAGDRDAAERVRAARKPTVAAWAINQLKREDSRKLNAFAKAVAKLEDGQRALIEEGDRDAFAKAGDAHRKALEALVAAGLDVAAAAGTARSAALEDRVTSTLQAATGDPEVLELIRAGRLDRERVPSASLEALPGSAAPRKAGAKRSKGAGPRRRLEAERTRARKAQGEVEDAEARLQEAREAEREAERAVRREQAHLREAKTKLATATERIAELESGD